MIEKRSPYLFLNRTPGSLKDYQTDFDSSTDVFKFQNAAQGLIS